MARFAFSAICADDGATHLLSSVEQFKEFISSPKTAVSIHATIRAPFIVTSGATNYQEQGTTAFRCLWSPTVMAYSERFERRMGSRLMEVIRDGDSFTTRAIEGETDLSITNSPTLCWSGSLSAPPDLHNPVQFRYSRALAHVGAVMNLGIPEIDIASARWNGESLSAEARSIFGPIAFSGKLAANSNGQPARLDLKRTTSGGTLHYSVYFRYAPSPLKRDFPSVPAHFSVYKSEPKTSTNKLVQEVSIESLAIIPVEDVRQEVERLTQLAAQVADQSVVLGGMVMTRLPDGQLIPKFKLKTPPFWRLSQSKGRILYWATTATLGAGFLLFLGRGERKHITSNQKHL